MEWKSRPLIFVCYCEDVKVYMLFDFYFKEVLFRRDVQFDEYLPIVDTLSPVSTPLPNPPTASLQDYFEDDFDDAADDPPSPPPPDPP